MQTRAPLRLAFAAALASRWLPGCSRKRRSSRASHLMAVHFETNRSMRPLKPLPIQACDVKPKLDENIDERLITPLRRAGHDAALLPESRHDPHPVP